MDPEWMGSANGAHRAPQEIDVPGQKIIPLPFQ
jgi:hypothetical protein